MPRILRLLIPLALGAGVLWFVWPYLQSEKRQAENMQRKLISLGAKRDWAGAHQLLALDYHDDWDFNREEAIQIATELFQSFLYLNIEWETTEVTVNQGIAKVRGIAKMNGSGAVPAPQIISTVNALEEPWVFTWRKETWKPDSWKLVSARNEGCKNRLLIPKFQGLIGGKGA